MLDRLKYLLTAAVLALLLAGLASCGGDDDDSAPEDEPTDSSSGDGSGDDGSGDDNGDDGSGDDNGDDGSGDDNGDDDGETGLDFGSGMAVVTIGEERFEFEITGDLASGVCRDVFGALQISATSSDGRDIRLDAILPPEDWATYDDNRYDPPSIGILDDSEQLRRDFRANEALEEFEGGGMSQVHSFERDGLTASGTATFIDSWAVVLGGDPDPVQGTFALDCTEG
ncbi:MAG: hypothetical protein WEC33_02650 [Dehalococcoidia bacterium]